ncbi:hypothetical protein STVIR_1340 [Streptomyces viridochromogenes Tue57]|uniref:Uncharacterized protein n=1 Tax=Streptomyces viridochromogenes Tue57 TaxID=1160705 RepID=L8PJJ1_STRVR|nr:hypothetical protein STVIR_1340 [Streptomyces viridochromogenes Tue57]
MRLLGRELQQLIGGCAVPLAGEAAQFFHVAVLRGELDQLVGRGGVALGGSCTQVGEIGQVGIGL